MLGLFQQVEQLHQRCASLRIENEGLLAAMQLRNAPGWQEYAGCCQKELNQIAQALMNPPEELCGSEKFHHWSGVLSGRAQELQKVVGEAQALQKKIDANAADIAVLDKKALSMARSA